SMSGKKWDFVFKWLAENSGKEVHASHNPTGTFTFNSPTGKRYTIPEVFDIINEALLSNPPTARYLLLERDRDYMLVPADDAIDPLYVPRISIKELDNRGRTALVQVVMKLKKSSVEDVAPEVQDMIGPFGKVTALKSVNSLLLRDTAGNLRRIK